MENECYCKYEDKRWSWIWMDMDSRLRLIKLAGRNIGLILHVTPANQVTLRHWWQSTTQCAAPPVQHFQCDVLAAHYNILQTALSYAETWLWGSAQCCIVSTGRDLIWPKIAPFGICHLSTILFPPHSALPPQDLVSMAKNMENKGN